MRSMLLLLALSGGALCFAPATARPASRCVQLSAPTPGTARARPAVALQQESEVERREREAEADAEGFSLQKWQAELAPGVEKAAGSLALIGKAFTGVVKPLLSTGGPPAAEGRSEAVAEATEAGAGGGAAAADETEEGWTLEKVTKLGLAGVISIAVAETVFWLLSIPVSQLVYYIATGEVINMFEQEGQLKFLAFTVGWGGIGGVIAQYRTVLTAAAMTPWMDENVVQPYLTPLIDEFQGKKAKK